MNLKKITIIITTLLFVSISNPVIADCLKIAQGITSSCLADSNGKVAVLYAQNTFCIRRRVSDISTAWKHFNAAVEATDISRIKAEAANVHYETQTRSSTFTSCWKTMKKTCELFGGAIDDAITVISSGTCK